MPNMHSVNHDKFIDNYLATFEGRIINKDRFTFGKLKNGYLVQFNMFLRFIPSYLHGA
jgi:hypothetical protein